MSTTPADESLTEGAPTPTPPVARDELGRRLEGLASVVEASRGLLDDDVLAPAGALTERVAERLRLSGEHTIVALAGATGSGKSSLFNALTDMELAGVGVRRPTTSWALACSWGPDGAEKLLEWMGIPTRHQVSRMSMLDRSSEDTRLDGLVLLDLPDHDSTEVAHHLEMDRLVQYCDMLVWVLDPQKYADAAIHERYIRPMAAFAEVTVVVLNQIDRIPYVQRQQALDDVKRLVADDGLGEVLVFGVSATRGDGLDDLRRELATRIRAKGAARSRLAADVNAAAQAVAAEGGDAPAPEITPQVRERLVDDLAESAGVPQVTAAIDASIRRRARQFTGWPVARRLRRRPDDSEGLDLGEDYSSEALARSVVPEVGPVQRADAELVVREAVDGLAAGLARPWRTAIRSAAGGAGIAGALDEAIASADVKAARSPLWWRAVQVLQWLLLLGAVVALVWWAAEAVASRASLTFDVPESGEIGGVTASPLIAVGCLVAGIVLALVSRLLARLTGRRRARKADAALRASIAAVADERVLQPVQVRLTQYATYREGLRAALG